MCQGSLSSLAAKQTLKHLTTLLQATLHIPQHPAEPHQPEPPLLVARLTSSLSRSFFVPSAQTPMASGTTLLLPRYTSNSALHSPGDSILMSGSACDRHSECLSHQHCSSPNRVCTRHTLDNMQHDDWFMKIYSGNAVDVLSTTTRPCDALLCRDTAGWYGQQARPGVVRGVG